MDSPYLIGLVSGVIVGITFSLILLALVLKPHDPWEQPNEQ